MGGLGQLFSEEELVRMRRQEDEYFARKDGSRTGSVVDSHRDKETNSSKNTGRRSHKSDGSMCCIT